MIAASFVRCADDIRQVRQLLPENDGDNIKTIAKTENAENRFL
ncbi:MAG: pyruvate kinase [Clostridia bacterium]|nr:pyruvate kinase [Clostridia bacterium]